MKYFYQTTTDRKGKSFTANSNSEALTKAKAIPGLTALFFWEDDHINPLYDRYCGDTQYCKKEIGHA